MTLEQRVTDLAQAIGADIKTLTSQIGEGGIEVNDAIVSGATTYSSAKLEEMLNPFALNSFTVSPSAALIGSAVASVTASWATSSTPDTGSISDRYGSVPLAFPATSKVLNNVSRTAPDVTFTLSVTRGAATKTKTATLAFLNNVYSGVSVNPRPTLAEITAGAPTLASSRARTLTFNCTGGRYFWFAYPARFGAGTFKVGGLSYTDAAAQTVSVTNTAGYTEDYLVHASNVIQFGASISLVIS